MIYLNYYLFIIFIFLNLRNPTTKIYKKNNNPKKIKFFYRINSFETLKNIFTKSLKIYKFRLDIHENFPQ